GGALLLAGRRAAEGEIFNIGTDEEITVRGLAERVRETCGSDSANELVAYEQIYGRSFEDMRRRVPNLQKIQRFVGYTPQVRLDQLLESVVRDTCQQMGSPVPAKLTTA